MPPKESFLPCVCNSRRVLFCFLPDALQKLPHKYPQNTFPTASIVSISKVTPLNNYFYITISNHIYQNHHRDYLVSKFPFFLPCSFHSSVSFSYFSLISPLRLEVSSPTPTLHPPPCISLAMFFEVCVCRGQKRSLDTLELELQAVVNHLI